MDWKTLDISENAELTYRNQKEYQFDIPDESFDVVLSVNVIEHVKQIWVWLRELSRVCRKGGHVITINPVSWPYHEYPVDCQQEKSMPSRRSRNPRYRSRWS